ncbi:addiction module protein [Myxococcota bacterium]|nr:addiction module protein [Myxococcota bacterium]
MANPFYDIAARAFALDPADRLRLAADLIDSVEGCTPDPAWSASWSVELDRRADEADRVGDQGRPWEEVRADLLRRLAGR